MKTYMLFLALIIGCDSTEAARRSPPAPQSPPATAVAPEKHGNNMFASLDKNDYVGYLRRGDMQHDVVLTALIEHEKSIYGNDDRVETMDESNAQRKSNANAVAALFNRGSVTRSADGKFFSLPATPLSVAKQLCKNENFYDQPSGARCTGFLIRRDLLATAGHCISNDNMESVRIVFGYRMGGAGVVLKVSAEDVFSVEEIVARVRDETDDYAIVRLNHSVPESRGSVLALSRTDASMADSVYVIGYPSGLPQKIAGRAKVRDVSSASYFVANLDTFGGNSGSPVFNALHEVVGILIRGEQDYRWDEREGCHRPMPCPDTGCSGEHVLKVSRFQNILR